MNKLERRVDKLDRRADETDEGVAMALAIAGFMTPPAGQRFALTANLGTFNSQNAVAFSGAVRVYRNVFVSTGVGVGLRHGKYGGRVGLAMSW